MALDLFHTYNQRKLEGRIQSTGCNGKEHVRKEIESSTERIDERVAKVTILKFTTEGNCDGSCKGKHDGMCFLR